MMKGLTIITISLVLGLFDGCMRKELELSPVAQDAVAGELSNYFAVPGQPIVVDFDSPSGRFNVDFDCTNALPPGSEVKLGYELLDDQGSILLRVKSSDNPASKESLERVQSASKNDEITVAFSLPPKDGNYKKAKFIRVESKVNFGEISQDRKLQAQNITGPQYGSESSNLQIPDASNVAGARERRLSNVGYTQDYSDYVCYTRLTDEDLRYLSPGELRVLRNTIYARHGRKFKSADLQRYFSKFSWYVPRYSEINPAEFTAIEKHNISLIQKYE